jgi:hypothetical protein
MCAAAWRVHHVRARTPPFVYGGDDCLFVLFDGSCEVRAITSPAGALAGALAAAAAAILLPLLGMAVRAPPPAAHACPPPMALTGCGLLLRAPSFGSWGGGRQVANSEVVFTTVSA